MLKLTNKHTDWKRFKQNIHKTIVLDMPLKNAKQIEAAVEYLNNIIQSTTWKATTVIRQKNNEYPLNIQNKIKDKRKLRSIWQRTHYSEDKRNFNRCTQELKQLIKSIKETRECRMRRMSWAWDWTLPKLVRALSYSIIVITPR